MAEYDPSTGTVDEVLKKLEKASDKDRQRILAAEQSGKHRTTILEAYGVDPNERTDATGRVLYPWEVAPKDEVHRDQGGEVEREPGDDQHAQGGVTPAGTETADPAPTV